MKNIKNKKIKISILVLLTLIAVISMLLNFKRIKNITERFCYILPAVQAVDTARLHGLHT